MADSDITVTSLAATPGAGNNLLTFGTSHPGSGCLTYLTLDVVEIWASTTNNRSVAAKIGQGVSSVIHAGLTGGTPWYYWARAKNSSGFYGEWSPVSSTAGLTATPGRALATGQVTNNDLAGGITDSKIANLSASKITAGTVSASITLSAPLITGGRMAISAGSFSAPIVEVGGNAGSNISTILVGQNGSASESAIWSINTGSGGTCHGIRGTWDPISGGGSSGIVGEASGRAFYAEIGTYGPFTGAHDAFILRESGGEPGDLVCDARVLARKGVDDAVTEVRLANAARDPSVVGVISRRGAAAESRKLAAFMESKHAASNFLRRYVAKHMDHLSINGVGEGQILVCGRGGDLAPGDYITTSDVPGKGMRQADDLKHNYTVAKCRERVKFNSPDDVKLVACIYECG